MKKLLIGLALLFLCYSCKKSNTDDTLHITVSDVATGSTYSLSAVKPSGTILNIPSSSVNQDYAVLANSGDVYTIKYAFYTPGSSVGIGTLRFTYRGQSKGASVNGSGTQTISIP